MLLLTNHQTILILVVFEAKDPNPKKKNSPPLEHAACMVFISEKNVVKRKKKNPKVKKM